MLEPGDSYGYPAGCKVTLRCTDELSDFFFKPLLTEKFLDQYIEFLLRKSPNMPESKDYFIVLFRLTYFLFFFPLISIVSSNSYFYYAAFSLFLGS